MTVLVLFHSPACHPGENDDMTTSQIERPNVPLFVWRNRATVDKKQAYRPGLDADCIYCRAAYTILANVHGQDPSFPHQEHYSGLCPRCGFWFDDHVYYGGHGAAVTFEVARLRRLDINDADVGLDELGAHLRRHFADVHVIPATRFEQLVGDVFRHMGYHVRLTQSSHDGGYDLVLLDGSGRGPVIVECKRYAERRPVRVGVVREVMGVQLVTGVRRAKVVTTSRFTYAAQDIANQLNVGPSGFEMELIDAQALAAALDVYNSQLPPDELVRLFGRQPLDEG